MQNELRGNISFASWPSKTVWWNCAKTGNKSVFFPPCTLQSCLWSHMCFTGHRRKQNSGSFKILLYMVWYETVSFKYLQKVIFGYFLAMLNFSFMPWNLNPCSPLVIPSGLRDSLRDFGPVTWISLRGAWTGGLQLLACRDWGWLRSHLAHLGQLCSLLVTPNQLPAGPQALLSSHSA